MYESLDQVVAQATVSVLEATAFMSVWPYSQEDGDLPKPDLIASIGFRGPVNGTLTLRVSSQVLPMLAQNMLGEDADSDSIEEKGRDALKEVLNIICGNLLTMWHGVDPVFRLNPPLLLNAGETNSGRPEASVSFTLESTLAQVEVFLDQTVHTDAVAEPCQTTA